MAKRRLRRPVEIFLRIIDMLTTIAAWQLSFYIRFHVMENAQSGLFTVFLYNSFFLAYLVVLFSTRNNLYESFRYFVWYKEFMLVIKSQLEAVITLVIFLYFIQPNRLSRITIGLYIGIGLIMALSSRGITRSILMRARIRGHNLRRVLVVGQGKRLSEYVNILAKNPQQGVRFIGWVSTGKLDDYCGIKPIKLNDISLEGSLAPDAVIIGFDADNHHQLDETLSIFNKTVIPTLVIPDIENVFTGYTIEDLHGLPIISVNSLKMNQYQIYLKRFIDILGSFLALIILSPLFLIISILVKLTSKGPVFYGQLRMTRDGNEFKMWKFRSMMVNAESSGPQWTSKKDDRRTVIGKFLRASNLDEIPQFWNVFKGDMSLVGPRPERQIFVEKFKHDIPSYMLRHRMKSGLTGWAQVNGWRGNTSLEKRIECDLYYIRNWSLMLDLKIIFLTVIKGFFHENAY